MNKKSSQEKKLKRESNIQKEFVEFLIPWIERNKITELELLSIFHEQMSYSIKHLIHGGK